MRSVSSWELAQIYRIVKEHERRINNDDLNDLATVVEAYKTLTLIEEQQVYLRANQVKPTPALESTADPARPTVTVDKQALEQVLSALTGPGHLIWELQTTRRSSIFEGAIMGTQSSQVKHALIACNEGDDLPVVTAHETISDFSMAVRDALFWPHESGLTLRHQEELAATVDVLLINGIAEFEGEPSLKYRREVWPFKDEMSGAEIREDRFYGFSDSGGLYASSSGYESSGAALSAIISEYGREQYYSDHPSDLGSAACCILSGREYVNRLYQIEETRRVAPSDGPLSEWGSWYVGGEITPVVLDETVPSAQELLPLSSGEPTYLEQELAQTLRSILAWLEPGSDRWASMPVELRIQIDVVLKMSEARAEGSVG